MAIVLLRSRNCLQTAIAAIWSLKGRTILICILSQTSFSLRWNIFQVFNNFIHVFKKSCFAIWYFIGTYLINRTLHGHLKVQNFSSCLGKFKHLFCSIVKYFSALEEEFYISEHQCACSIFSLSSQNIMKLLLPLVWSEANLANCFEYSRASLCRPSLRRSRYFNLCSLNSRELPLTLSSMCRACAHLKHNKTNNINLSAYSTGMD